MKRINLKKRFILMVAVAGLVAGNAFAQDLASAQALTKSEQYDQAENLLQQLIQKEPSNSKYHFFLGENYLLSYFSDTISNSLAVFTQQAKEAFQKGVEANPNDPLNYVGLAKVAAYLGDDNTAQEMRTKARSLLLPFKNLRRIDPPADQYAFALAKIAESHLINGKVDTAAALPHIREALKIDAKNPEIYLIAGDIYIAGGDGSNAIKNYNMAQYYDPESPTAEMKIGNIYIRGKSLTAAMPHLERAIEIDPEFAPAYRELGQLYSLAGRHEQSKEYYQKYLDLNEGNIPAMTRYVTSLFYAGDYEEVINRVEEIFKVDKSRTYMNRLAGYSSFELASKNKNGNYDQAFSYMDELFNSLSEDRILWKDHLYMARILIRRNQNYLQLKEQGTEEEIAKAEAELERAFSEYKKVSEMRPQDKAVVNELASNYYNFRFYNEAAETWASLIDPESDNLDSYMQVGRAYYTGRDYEKADSIFNVILEKSPDYIPAHLWLARTAAGMDPDNKTDNARTKFMNLIHAAESDSIKNKAEMSEALRFLGSYYLNTNNYSRARDLYTRLLNIDPKDKNNRINAYNGLGATEMMSVSNQKTIEGRLAALARSREAYQQILTFDPNNASAKRQIEYVRDYEAQVRKGINPNEIKGVVKDAATGQPIPFASVRIKDTAVECLTNTRGEYKFEIPQSSEILIFSAKGYQNIEVPVTKNRTYNASLSK